MGFFSNLFGKQEAEANTAESVQPTETSMAENMAENEEVGSSTLESADTSADLGETESTGEESPASAEPVEEETQQ